MMSIKESYNFPVNLEIIENNDLVMFQFGDFKTNWTKKDDPFIFRFTLDYLNPDNLDKHLAYEIKIKNRFDEAVNYLNHENPKKAIVCLDDVIYYTPNDARVLFYKSKALFMQRHFIKSLRYYKKAIKNDSNFKDNDYYKALLDKSKNERENFPKIKFHIYTGDEFFKNGECEKAIKHYDKALTNPSKFKDKILYRLLNKKATALLKLKRNSQALDCFNESISVCNNDYAHYGCGLVYYRLNNDSHDDKKVYRDHILDSFEKAKNISKRQLLKKALILNEIGCFNESMEYFDEFLDNHFVKDDDYKKAMEGRSSALKNKFKSQ